MAGKRNNKSINGLREIKTARQRCPEEVQCVVLTAFGPRDRSISPHALQRMAGAGRVRLVEGEAALVFANVEVARRARDRILPMKQVGGSIITLYLGS